MLRTPVTLIRPTQALLVRSAISYNSFCSHAQKRDEKLAEAADSSKTWTDRAKSAVEGGKEALKDATGAESVSEAGQKLKNSANSTYQNAKQEYNKPSSDTTQTVKNAASDAAQTAKNVASDAAQKVKNAASGAAQAANNAAAGAGTTAQTAWETTKNVASSAAETVKNVAGSATETVKNVAETVTEKAKEVFGADTNSSSSGSNAGKHQNDQSTLHQGRAQQQNQHNQQGGVNQPGSSMGSSETKKH